VHPINWIIVVGWLGYVVWDGLRKSRSTDIEGYFLAGRSLPWWAVGLSVMATQLSAITMIGGTGQGATDGLRFIQFYFGLPIAMVILGVTLVPFLHGAKVFTAYEYLERRFGAPTRSLTAFLFLLSRGLSCGTIIAAPAVVFSAIFGWDLKWSVALIGLPTVAYTAIGGVKAVTWVDVKQMVLIVGALVAIVVTLLVKLPVSPVDALHIAGAAGRTQAFDFSFNLENRYTFWAGIFGGTFLMLSYFGTDQSQVQRYLSARSVDEARSSLLMSAYWKIPLQALVLLIGVLTFVFFVFARPPLLYNPAHERLVQERAPQEYARDAASYNVALFARDSAARRIASATAESDRDAAVADFKRAQDGVKAARDSALAQVGRFTDGPTADVNYVMPRFVLEYLPIGLVGVFIAAVIAAAMNAVAAELNSLATTSVIDFYRRWVRPEGTDAHFLAVSRVATAIWGVIACFVALYAANLGSLIEVVNRFGSVFYGSILGVFLLAMIPRARELGAFVGLMAGMAAVLSTIVFAPKVSYLWHNVIGAVTVVLVGYLLSLGGRDHRTSAAT
jgi:solute:Na+ symporter, SSS family